MGMVIATLIEILVVPALFYIIHNISKKRSKNIERVQ